MGDSLAADSDANSGLVALATILAMHRIAVDPDQLRHALGHFDACSPDDLLRIAKRQDGVRAKVVTARFDRLARLPLPALAHGSCGWFVIGRVAEDRALIQRPGCSPEQLDAAALDARYRALSRQFHPDYFQGASVGDRLQEIAAGLGIVLVLTGLLVDRSPDVAGVAAPPAVQSTVLGKIEAKATVASPVTGPSAVTLELLDSAGRPTEGYAAPRATLSAGTLDLGDVALQNVGPGVYAGQVIFPAPGRWELQVSLRTGEFDNPVGSVEFTVKESS